MRIMCLVVVIAVSLFGGCKKKAVSRVDPSDVNGRADSVLTANPGERQTLTHLRHVVRRGDAGSLARDLDVLRRHAVLDALHPGLREKLTRLAQTPNRATLYAVPYSIAYADESIRAHRLLHEAADAVERDDEEFARFLKEDLEKYAAIAKAAGIKPE